MTASSPSGTTKRPRAPLTEGLVLAVASLVDDALGVTREPSHSEILFQVERAELGGADPQRKGQTVGKAKRVRSILSWALDNAPNKGEALVAALVALVRAKGGFRVGSPNFVGVEAIANAAEAFKSEGYALAADGDLRPTLLDTLSGADLTQALASYVQRAKRGSADAALVLGTGKDLLEATAAHVISERYGTYNHQTNFPTLLGQAFVALGLAIPEEVLQPGEPPQRRLERALYEAGCAVNALRNKQGTGHGRPFLPALSDTEALSAIQLIGIVAGVLLTAHQKTKK